MHKLEKAVEGLNFLKGLLGARSVGFKIGEEVKERRRLLHSVSISYFSLSNAEITPSFVGVKSTINVVDPRHEIIAAFHQASSVRPYSKFRRVHNDHYKPMDRGGERRNRGPIALPAPVDELERSEHFWRGIRDLGNLPSF